MSKKTVSIISIVLIAALLLTLIISAIGSAFAAELPEANASGLQESVFAEQAIQIVHTDGAGIAV